MTDELTRAIAEALVRRHHLNTADLASDIAAALAPLIEARVREARADAWDEGYTSGHSNAMRRMSDEPNAPTTPNPHREELRRG